MKIIPEQVIQQECFNWFNNTYCLKFHIPRLLIHSVPNGIPIDLEPKERARALDLLHKTGMVNGVSDLIIHGKNGRCIHAECKTYIGKQSDAQIEIQSRVDALGGIYFVFRNLEQFQREISNNLDWLLGKI
jgi:hypothetical protein